MFLASWFGEFFNQEYLLVEMLGHLGFPSVKMLELS